MRRWAILLVALLALGAAVPAVDAKPRLTKKQQRCLKAAKEKRTKAKRRAAKKRCLRKHRKPAAKAPQAPAPAASTPSAPAPSSPVTTAPTTPEDPGGPTLPEDPGGGGRAVQVQSGEWYLRLSRASVLAGDVRVEFDNTRGEDPHDLKLLRGSTVYRFDEQPSGGITAKTLHLSAGTWQLFCALPEHAERGMKAQLSVTSG